MNTLTKTILSTIAAIATTTPAMANGNQEYSAHITLGQTIRSTGIEFKLNPRECEAKNAMGWYWAAKNEMVICQENHVPAHGFGTEVFWTAEDLDTLRHEAQHLIQDCIDGSRQGRLSAVYKDPIELAQEVLGDRGIRSVLGMYSDASDHIKVMELEAFAVARMNKPLAQSGDIKHYCF